MNRIVTSQEILIIMTPALALAAFAFILWVGLKVWESRYGR